MNPFATLDRYLARRLLWNLMIALTGLVAVFAMIRLTDEMGRVGQGAYGVLGAVRYVFLTLPGEAYRLLPAAALVGTVNALGELATAGELIAMTAAGVSRLRLIIMVLRPALAFLLLAAVGAELGAAPLAQTARTERSVLLSSGRSLSTGAGVWLRDADGRFFRIRDALGQEALRGVEVFEFDAERRLSHFVRARTASDIDGRWQLQGVVERRISDEGVERVEEDRRILEGAEGLASLRRLAFSTEDLSVASLWSQIGLLRERGQNVRSHELALWRRLATPLVATAMVFLAVPLFLAAPPRSSLGVRVVLAALAGLGFQLLSQSGSRLGVLYGFDPALVAFAPVGAIFVLGALSVSRIR